MRIGVNLLYLIPGEVGGTETYAREMVRALSRGYPQDRLTLFCNRENAESFGEAGGNVARVVCGVRARGRAARIAYEQFILPRRAAEAGVEVLWSPGYTMPLRAGCPQAVTIHDVQYRYHPEDLSWAELAATRALVWGSCRRAAGILTASENSAADLRRWNGVRGERLRVTPYGVSEFLRSADGEGEAERLAAEAGVRGPFLLTVANSYPHKNLAGLAAAFNRLEGVNPHAGGIGGQARRGEEALQAALRGLREPGRVRRLRGLSPATLRALYRKAELFVFPTLFEGFGLPVVEAMACGAPVACSNIPVLREVAGDAAAFFDPLDAEGTAEALRDLLEDPEALRALGDRGRRRAEGFTWERTARATREFLARLAAQR